MEALNMTQISRRTIRSLVLTATVAVLAVAVGPLASSATAKDKTLVVPGKSIGGVKLGQSRKAVRAAKPLGLKKPTAGSAVGDTYTSKIGATIVVLYGLGKKKPVIGISTGIGPWHTANGLVDGASPSQAASLVPGCVFYSSFNGVREYNPGPSEGQYCELVFQGPARYFYLTFNPGDFTPGSTAALAGFTLSKVFVP